TLSEVGPGRAVMQMTVTDAMLNGHDVCHGGFLFTLADTAFAYACNSQDEAALAQGASIDFLKPAHAGDVLTATAVQLQQGRRTGLYDVTVTNQAQQRLALFRGRAFRVGGSVTRENDE
ncbi:MAG: hydroxyphenylacetyl-CoA thioesterase PaaI, partial [Gammaproteobacteria bacterium]|nr:hydroxyphenylacetyl-CoA thioesterase PaaI [Gammaproteobacteria bacterium]